MNVIMTAIHFSAADFVKQYTTSKNKEDEVLAIVRAFEKFSEDQQEMLKEHKQNILKEIDNKDLATKGDVALVRQELHAFRQEVRQEFTHYATKKELVETVNHAVNTGKWQVIGAVAAMLFAEIALRHLGF